MKDALPVHTYSRAVGRNGTPGAREGAAACEVVQYVTGLARGAAPGELLLGYGVGDCEPRFTALSLEAVRRELRPLRSTSDPPREGLRELRRVMHERRDKAALR